MLGLYDRLLLTASQRAIVTRPTPSEFRSETIGDSFILDWSLDCTDATEAADYDAAIELCSMK